MLRLDDELFSFTHGGSRLAVLNARILELFINFIIHVN